MAGKGGQPRMHIGWRVLVLSACAAIGCGPAESPRLAACLADGAWRAQGPSYCNISTFNLSSSPGLTLTNFGENPSVTFAIDADGRAATAMGLLIVGVPDQTCTLSCKSASALALRCEKEAGAGKCDSTFMLQTTALGGR
jgi:hypothetical protein